MSREGWIAIACLALASASSLGALRCLADRLLASAALYTAVALALMAGAAKAGLEAF